MEKNLSAAADFIVQKMKSNLSQSGDSQPNEFPASDTGTLRSSIFAEVKELVATIGSTDPKAIYLETGTTKMEPRPFLKRTILENKREILEILLQQ